MLYKAKAELHAKFFKIGVQNHLITFSFAAVVVGFYRELVAI
jgi:hypothetical protein